MHTSLTIEKRGLFRACFQFIRKTRPLTTKINCTFIWIFLFERIFYANFLCLTVMIVYRTKTYWPLEIPFSWLFTFYTNCFIMIIVLSITRNHLFLLIFWRDYCRHLLILTVLLFKTIELVLKTSTSGCLEIPYTWLLTFYTGTSIIKRIFRASNDFFVIFFFRFLAAYMLTPAVSQPLRANTLNILEISWLFTFYTSCPIPKMVLLFLAFFNCWKNDKHFSAFTDMIFFIILSFFWAWNTFFQKKFKHFSFRTSDTIIFRIFKRCIFWTC